MSACVLDASAVLSVLVSGQSSPAARSFFQLAEDSWTAPRLMSLETRNALVRLERRRLLAAGAADAALALLESRVFFAPAPSAASLPGIVARARSLDLGIYDAVYLDLAVRTGAALASRDGALLKVAGKLGVPLRDLR